MDKKIQIFGKNFKQGDLWIYIIFIVVFSIYSFIEKPFIESKYLKSDIKNFADYHFFKVYVFTVAFALVFVLIKIWKKKELLGQAVMNLILFFTFTYIFFNNFITTQVLFLNQIKSSEKEKVIYEVFNHDKLILITDVKNGNHSDFNIYKEEFIEKIEKKRQMNQQKTLNQIKHGDTIHVLYEKGLIGFKYLN